MPGTRNKRLLFAVALALMPVDRGVEDAIQLLVGARALRARGVLGLARLPDLVGHRVRRLIEIGGRDCVSGGARVHLEALMPIRKHVEEAADRHASVIALFELCAPLARPVKVGALRLLAGTAVDRRLQRAVEFGNRPMLLQRFGIVKLCLEVAPAVAPVAGRPIEQYLVALAIGRVAIRDRLGGAIDQRVELAVIVSVRRGERRVATGQRLPVAFTHGYRNCAHVTNLLKCPLTI